jgi:hypothetical protein
VVVFGGDKMEGVERGNSGGFFDDVLCIFVVVLWWSVIEYIE